MTLPVTIVGAGPTGLTLALELARRQVPCRIVDKAARPSLLDRATVVHPLTLEMMERIGCVEGMLAGGVRMRKTFLYNGDRLITTSEWDVADSRYRYELGISQAKVEEVLRLHLEKLGVQVEWNTEVTAFHQTGDTVEVAIQGQAPLQTSWLVGCDGYHSIVRTLLDEPFAGEDYPESWCVIEGHIDGLPFAEDEVAIMTGAHCMFCTPLPGGRRRLIFTGGVDATPSEEAALGLLATLLPGHLLTIRDISDQARFRAHKRGAHTLRHGRCLLAGDAAHAMSPAGGQGMNLGIHDAHNLGWKLARVVQGLSSPALLDSYEPERRPSTEAGFASSDRSHKDLTLTGSASFRRDDLWRAAASVPAQQAWALNGNMQLRMDFPQSPLVLGVPDRALAAGHPTWAGPAPGERVRDEGPLHLEGGAPASLHSLMRHTEHTLLLMRGDNDGSTPEWLAEEAQKLKATTTVINAATDPALYVHRRLGITRDTLFALRPDGYVGLRSEKMEASALQSYRALLEG